MDHALDVFSETRGAVFSFGLVDSASGGLGAFLFVKTLTRIRVAAFFPPKRS